VVMIVGKNQAVSRAERNLKKGGSAEGDSNPKVGGVLLKRRAEEEEGCSVRETRKKNSFPKWNPWRKGTEGKKKQGGKPQGG